MNYTYYLQTYKLHSFLRLKPAQVILLLNACLQNIVCTQATIQLQLQHITIHCCVPFFVYMFEWLHSSFQFLKQHDGCVNTGRKAVLQPRIEIMRKTHRKRHIQRFTLKTCKGSSRNHDYNFRVFYKDGTIAVDNQMLTRDQTLLPPSFAFEPRKDKYYTLVLYDPDAPDPAYLHWLVPNITNGLHAATVSYEPPHPPSTHTHYHVYTFDLFEHSNPIKYRVLSRTRFDPEFYLKEGMDRVGRTAFYIDPRAPKI